MDSRNNPHHPYIVPSARAQEPLSFCGLCGSDTHTIGQCRSWREPVDMICPDCGARHFGRCPNYCGSYTED